MSSELPHILSDEEFAKLLKARDESLRALHDGWDISSPKPAPRTRDGRPESTIEQQFPHVAAKLVAYWCSDVCAMYISDLIVSKRETRSGFPPDVIEDLLMLSEINEMLIQPYRRAAAVKPFADELPKRMR